MKSTICTGTNIEYYGGPKLPSTIIYMYYNIKKYTTNLINTAPTFKNRLPKLQNLTRTFRNTPPILKIELYHMELPCFNNHF